MNRPKRLIIMSDLRLLQLEKGRLKSSGQFSNERQNNYRIRNRKYCKTLRNNTI